MDRNRECRIGDWLVVPAENRLEGPDGESVHVSPKAMDVLGCLARSRGGVLAKEELLDAVWGTRFVSEGVLANAIRELRAAFSDDARHPAYIETIPKRGYRLAAGVREAQVTPDAGAGSSEIRPRPAWAGAAALLLAVAALALWSGMTRAPEPARLAVLSFDDLSAAPADPAFAHGIADLLITELAGISGLHVISGDGLVRLSDPDEPEGPVEIARRLGAELLLRGRVLLSEGRVRVNTHLIDGGSGVHLWSGTYESDLANVLDLQRDVARAVAREVRVRLGPAERDRLAQKQNVDPEAFLDFTRGVHLFDQWDFPSLPRSVEFFERAIAKDAQFAPAQARLARSLVALAVVEALPPAGAHERALRAARIAARLDHGLAEAHAALALVKLVLEWDLSGAEVALARALALNPSSVLAHETESLLHMAAGRHDENVAAMRRAHELAPLSYYTNLRLGWSYYMAGRNEEAIQVLERTLEMYPEKRVVHIFLARNHAMLDQSDKALAACERHDHPCLWVRARLGLLDEPERWVQELRAEKYQYGPGYPDRVRAAGVLAALGSVDEAFRHLELAIAESSPDAVFLVGNPTLEPLWRDERWPALLERIGTGSPLLLAGQAR